MEDIKKTPLVTLVDMLAMYTSDYLRILRDGGTKEEYENCKRFIKKLTAEIELRKKAGASQRDADGHIS